LALTRKANVHLSNAVTLHLCYDIDMKVLLVSANTEQVNMPVMPLGLACVKEAVRQAGHDVHALNLMTPEDTDVDLPAAIRNVEPDVIGISVRNIDDQSLTAPRFLLDAVRPVMATCRRLSRAPVVLGGAGFSIFPQDVLDYLGADYGIQGEGEGVFVDLLSCLSQRVPVPLLPGLYFSDGRKPRAPETETVLDNHALPEPDGALSSHPGFDPHNIWLPFQTRRGCPLGCSYCSTPAIEGTRLRKRSPENVVAALGRQVAAGLSRFFFVDNTFNLPLSYAKALCDAIIASGLKIQWQAIVYPNFMDEELVRKMARAGCVQVSLGFESGDEGILKGMNKRTDPATITRISGMFGDQGIRRMGFLLLGGPGETRDTVLRSLDFVRRLQPEMMRITVGIRIYPHTAMERIARAEGVVPPGDALLQPRFYLRKELTPWLQKTVRALAAEHPNWIT
jgi:radical SAM superfamily enzyme YgiQ (UPF0313 family)